MSQHLQAELQSNISVFRRTVLDQAGREISIIKEAEAIDLATHAQVHLREIYIKAMSINVWPYRYIRNSQSISIQEQLALARSCVAVIGAGGLGGQIILLLARIGIGRLLIIDPDKFDETNLNRQVLAFDYTIGVPKAEAAVKILSSVNPAVETIPIVDRLTARNSPELLAGVDVIADALDNISDRLMLQVQAEKFDIPLVHGTVAGFDGQVMTIYPGDRSLDTMYDSGDQGIPNVAAESILGVPAVSPAVIGAFQAMEIVKILLKRGCVFQKKLLYTELESGKFQELNLIK